MEQVAETLRAFKANCSQEEWDEYINLIEEETRDDERIYCFKSEITSVIDSIISVNGKKSPVIEWHDRTDSGLLLPPQKFDWEHDITGDLYDNMYFLEKRFSEHASKWTDGIFGGNCFKVGDEKFFTTEATRGIGYTALIAFDQFGNGAVFVNDTALMPHHATFI